MTDSLPVESVRNLRRLWRHRLFRRLLAVRIAVQSCDGLLQVGLASYVVFSTQRQADAVSIATVLAVTLLPFSVVGPFVSVVLDRWSRRQALVAADVGRVVLALVLAALVVAGQTGGGAGELAFYAIVLVLMSLNRFVLAALAASLPHTIDPDEYVIANSVMPTIGPIGAIVGAGTGLAVRLLAGPYLPGNLTDGILFAAAGLGYAVSVALALRLPRHGLGPDVDDPSRAADIWRGLVDAVRHLAQRSPAGAGLLAIAAHRIPYGVVTVATILVYRNYFHPPTEVDAALADLGVLLGATAAGFVLAAVVTPPATRRWGLRRWLVVSLVASAVLQVLPGAIYTRPTLVVAAFGTGLMAQSIKIVVDTLVQVHVDDEVKGRTFVFYDMIFNVCLVLGAVLCAALFPADGVFVAGLVVVAVCYLLTALAVAVVSRRIGVDRFDRATGEPVHTAAPTGDRPS